MQNPPPKHYQWQKGQSGNPGGMPKSNLSSILGKWLSSYDPKTKKRRDQMLVEQVWKLAMEVGDLKAAQYLWDRMEGSVANKLELSGHVDPHPELSPEELAQRLLNKGKQGGA